MHMTTSARGLKAIEVREGVRLRAYQDTRGIWTIGVGHTSAAGLPAVFRGQSITMTECSAILAQDLGQVEQAVNEAVEVTISQNAFDACVSLAFNIGAPGFRGSTVVRRINDGNMQAAADAFLMWNRPPEILGRRKGERAQFLRPDGAADDRTADPENPVGSIAWVQTRLNLWGANPPLAVDGDYGPATDGAVMAFQGGHGLLVDGHAGPATIAALGQVPSHG